MEYQNNTNNNEFNGSYKDDYNYSNNYNNNSPDFRGYAIGSMVCGILSIVLCCCYGVVGIILAIVSLILAFIAKKYNNGNFPGQALAGLICSIIGLVLSICMLASIIYVLINFKDFNAYYEWIKGGL